MDPTHRKIDLQSPADLAHLSNTLRAAALAKLDLHLPAQTLSNNGTLHSNGTSASASHAPPEDELRASVEAMVNAFVTSVIRGMRTNTSVNGVDVVPPPRVQPSGSGSDPYAMDEDTATAAAAEPSNSPEDEAEEEPAYIAPFDEKLRAQLGAAVRRRDALAAKISAHRGATPAAAARAWEARFASESAALGLGLGPSLGLGPGDDDAPAKRERGNDPEKEEEEEEEEEDDASAGLLHPLARQEDVERSWARALEGLAQLQRELPETRARLERCGEVVRHLGEGTAGVKASDKLAA